MMVSRNKINGIDRVEKRNPVIAERIFDKAIDFSDPIVSSQKDGVGVLVKWFHHFTNTPFLRFIEMIHSILLKKRTYSK